ncbi:MerR family transcriptional regulator [Nocardia colli]|uniref:MerR family transcriptional regulator n=1 Tax=Nocardia colli TaxID=2545717 RepID=A0A5N0EHB0_9NOCA|nr:MerR family transcriptional regulator [Nocardia colli]
MAWSTRQLAELAGTSIRTVRHYHDVGLLAEPERMPNGYKSYDETHLARLLRVKHLADLGFSLAQIARMGETGPSEQSVRALDADLAAAIERLQRMRAELAQTLHPVDIPARPAPAGLQPIG